MCYDSKVLNDMDYYVFFGQVVNERKQDKLIAITFFPEVWVTAEKALSLIAKLCGLLLNKTFCVMSDTTALNTGEKRHK